MKHLSKCLILWTRVYKIFLSEIIWLHLLLNYWHASMTAHSSSAGWLWASQSLLAPGRKQWQSTSERYCHKIYMDCLCSLLDLKPPTNQPNKIELHIFKIGWDWGNQLLIIQWFWKFIKINLLNFVLTLISKYLEICNVYWSK